MTPTRRHLLVLPALVLMTRQARAATIATARGPFSFAAPPRRIAVLDLPTLDTLTALAVTPVGVPSPLYLEELKAAHGAVPAVGSLFEPDLEALYRLKPDLVVVGGRSAPVYDTVGRIAPVIDMSLPGEHLLAQTAERIAALGALCGKAEAGGGLVEALRRRADACRAAIAGKGHGLIIMTNGPKLSAYGPASRNGWIHSELGLPPSVPGIGTATHGESISFEFIRKADPDWLIVLDRGAAIGESVASARATLDNALLRDMRIFTENRIVFMPPGEFYLGAGGAGATTRLLGALEAAFAVAQR